MCLLGGMGRSPRDRLVWQEAIVYKRVGPFVSVQRFGGFGPFVYIVLAGWSICVHSFGGLVRLYTMFWVFNVLMEEARVKNYPRTVFGSPLMYIVFNLIFHHMYLLILFISYNNFMFTQYFRFGLRYYVHIKIVLKVVSSVTMTQSF